MLQFACCPEPDRLGVRTQRACLIGAYGRRAIRDPRSPQLPLLFVVSRRICAAADGRASLAQPVPGPLSHLTVLDLSRVLAGPWCTQLLGDLGASVIKIERPGGGDDTRAWGPPYLKDRRGNDTSEAAYYLCCNRAKRSVAVDFTKPQGQRIVRDLAMQADVLIENFKVGSLARYGLDYANVSGDNPSIVYASITGFGQDGPYADRAGYDFIIQGMSGFMSVTGERDDLPGGGPQKAGVAITDLMTGMYAAVAILAAISHRERTGRGQHVDLALLDSAVSMMSVMNLNYLATGVPPGRVGNAHPNIVPYQVFACADGHLILAVGNDGQFAKFCAVACKPEWASDPRYATNAERVRNRAELVPLVARVLATRTQRDWLAALEAAGVPCGPINRLDQVFSDPQVVARGLKLELPHPVAGAAPQVATPIRYSETPIEYRDPPPLLGEHTASVLRERLGYDDATIGALAQRGVIGLC
jgi:crotonobetainyl-CoA:carnitine CoA-transferase CaiB-like acyl-CoA transferase